MRRRVEGWVVDRFYGGRVVKDVVLLCLSSDMLDQLREFMEEHTEQFNAHRHGADAGSGKQSEAAADRGDEHSLEDTAIHRKYCELVESCLEKPLRKHKKTFEDFYELCRRIKEAGHASEIEPFLHILFAATDYLLFADVMRDPDKRAYFFQILGGLQSHVRNKLNSKKSSRKFLKKNAKKFDRK